MNIYTEFEIEEMRVDWMRMRRLGIRYARNWMNRFDVEGKGKGTKLICRCNKFNQSIVVDSAFSTSASCHSLAYHC